MKALFLKFKRVVLMRLFSRTTVLLLEWKAQPNPISEARIEFVRPENVIDARAFQTDKQVKLFSDFLTRGDKGYYAYVDNACVHRSWAVIGPAKVFLHKFFSLRISASEVFIQYCETAPVARGKNIFAHVLSYIAHQFKDKRVLTSVNLDNTSSRRGMEKAGFSEVDRIKIIMILGVRFVWHEYR
jgi:hypothetical protein